MILKERIKAVVDYSGMSITEFTKFVGFKTPQTVRSLLSGATKSLSDAVALKILFSFPLLNPAWIRDGEGEMLRPSSEARAGIRQDHNPNSTVFGCVSIAVPEKGKKKILTSDGLVVEGDDSAAERLEHYMAIIAAKDGQISRLMAMIEEKDKTIAKLLEKL